MLKKIWLFTKRVIFFVLSLMMFVVGGGGIISVFLGAYGRGDIWMYIVMFLLSLAALAMSYFMMRYIVFGSDKDLEDADINPGPGDFF